MARKLTQEDYDALFADMSPGARRWFVRRAINISGRAMKDAEAKDESGEYLLSPAQRASIANQSLKNLEIVAGIHARARSDEDVAVRIMQALAKTGEPESRAPRGAPPHIAAIWSLFRSGDADAERVVNDWLEGKGADGSSGPADS